MTLDTEAPPHRNPRGRSLPTWSRDPTPGTGPVVRPEQVFGDRDKVGGPPKLGKAPRVRHRSRRYVGGRGGVVSVGGRGLTGKCFVLMVMEDSLWTGAPPLTGSGPEHVCGEDGRREGGRDNRDGAPSEGVAGGGRDGGGPTTPRRSSLPPTPSSAESCLFERRQQPRLGWRGRQRTVLSTPQSRGEGWYGRGGSVRNN